MLMNPAFFESDLDRQARPCATGRLMARSRQTTLSVRRTLQHKQCPCQVPQRLEKQIQKQRDSRIIGDGVPQFQLDAILSGRIIFVRVRRAFAFSLCRSRAAKPACPVT
jgi:hypothetical protein